MTFRNFHISSNDLRTRYVLANGEPTVIETLIEWIVTETSKIIVIDSRESKEYKEVTGGHIFSPDSKRTAFVARKGDKEVAVIDDKESNEYSMLSDIVLSPDSIGT
ncbi:MAG: hypothetical protein ACK4NF_00490 [Planctomycetota bacterium]